tara:strand:- start:309 stop:1052 length:744 start_codon:yes stop_codon:yes gene_type:complete
MFFQLCKKPFSKSLLLSEKVVNNLLQSLPNQNNVKSKIIKEFYGQKSFDKLITRNWDCGSYNLDKNAINKLSSNSAINEIKRKLILLHNIKHKDIILKHGCIFNPSQCKFSFELNQQKYIYHKYHLDSAYRIKALILLEESENENQQFSYIRKFPEPFIYYFFRRHIWSQFIILFHRFLYIVSLRKIKLSGQAPQLPDIYQNSDLYLKYNSLKKGEMITFHNLYPHSSHNGFSRHKTPMLQLVFDTN